MKAFLSHSSKDKEIVGAVATLLERQYCVFDARSFDSGIEFKKSIEQGLDDSSVFVLFASKSSLDALWVEFEIEEAWYQRLRNKLSMALVYLIDSSVELSSLPEWLKRASIRKANAPQAIARDIRHHLDNLLLERQRPYFTGRSSDIENLEQALTPLGDLTPPHSFVISGLPGIGRRAFVKHTIPSILQLRKFVEIRVGEGDTINDICINIADKIEPYNTMKGLTAIIEDIRSMSEDLALQRIKGNLVSLNISNELPVFFDEGGFMDAEGHFREEIEKLVDSIQSTNEVYASFISWRRPTLEIKTPLPIIQLKPLGDDETKRLLKLLARRNNLDVLAEQVDELAEYIGGYPPAAYFVVQLCKDYGIELMLREKTSLTRFTSTIFLRHFSKIGLSRDEKRILKLLASYSPLPLGTITEILGIDVNKLDKLLIRLIDLALIISNECSHYQIADPISDASKIAFGYLDPNEHSKVAKSLSAYLANAPLEGPQLQLSRLLFIAARLSGDLDLAKTTIHLSNDLIRLTETLYHQRKYKEAIETGYLALEERPNSITARRYLIRGLIQEERWPEAEKHIEEFKKYATRYEILYLKGFLSRHRSEIPDAIKYYRASKKLGWTGVSISRELAYCYFLNGDYDPAADYIREARELQSDNRFLVDLAAQIAIARHDRESAKEDLAILHVIDEPIYYYHRLSTYEREFGTSNKALEAAKKAAQCEANPPFPVLAQLMCCQMGSRDTEGARETSQILDKRFARVKHDIRQCLRCKLENIDGHFSEALRILKYVKNKEDIVYKKLQAEALKGELDGSALDDETRIQYQTELDTITSQLEDKAMEDLLLLIFGSEQS